MRVWIEDRRGDGKMVVAGVCCKVVLATGVVIVVVTGCRLIVIWLGCDYRGW